MNIEKFLGFWSAHNTHIIELLIAAVLLSIIYLAFRTFFGENSETGNTSTTSRMNPDDLQRTLQKIIESQSNPAGASSTSAGIAAGASANAGAGAVAATGADPAQLEKLKTEIQEREKTIQALKDQMQQLGANQGAAAAAASKELESKLKDLEARLAEYEIISEDIADITFYKEENTRLQKELASAKSGGGSSPAAAVPPAAAPASAPPAAPAAAPATAAPVAPEPVIAAAPPAAELIPEALAAVIEEPVAPPAVEVAAAPAPEAPATAAPVATEPAAPAAAATEPAPAAGSAVPDLGPIDDDLMKEFASAVEEQKVAAAAAKQATGTKNGKPGDKNLMGEFENFMKKG